MYFYVQNRIQTWLDLCTVSRSGGKPERLLRDATEAWIQSPGELTFLKDGSFLLSSERTGWKHLYLYDKTGQLQHAVTEGQWEARSLHCVDEENGWVYFTGTRDSHIAGAPVTDWRLYDTIYTERYMDTPQNNPEGYEKTSVVEAAEKLHGRLLLVHGVIDDNVHVQNTYQLMEALQRADRDFDVMVYPQSRHGIGAMHYSRLRVDFIKSVLKLSN